MAKILKLKINIRMQILQINNNNCSVGPYNECLTLEDFKDNIRLRHELIGSICFINSNHFSSFL